MYPIQRLLAGVTQRSLGVTHNRSLGVTPSRSLGAIQGMDTGVLHESLEEVWVWIMLQEEDHQKFSGMLDLFVGSLLTKNTNNKKQ